MIQFLIGMSDTNTSNSYLPIPADYRCIVYQIAHIIGEVTNPFAFYYTIVSDTKYWRKIATVTEVKPTESTKLLQTCCKAHMVLIFLSYT